MGTTKSTSFGNRKVGKRLFSVMGLTLVFVGILLLRQARNTLQETKAMQQWTQTPCTIVSSEMVTEGKGYRLDVSYRYNVGKKIYTSTRYGKSPRYTTESISEMDRTRKRLAPEKTTICYYNPLNPTEALLDRPSMKRALLAAGIPLLLSGLGLFLAILPWLHGHGKEKDADSP